MKVYSNAFHCRKSVDLRNPTTGGAWRTPKPDAMDIDTMISEEKRMTRSKTAPISFRILPVLLTAACMAAPLAAAPPFDGEEPESPATEASPAEVGASGMRIVVDQKTGEVVSARAGESHVLSEALEHALSRSAGGLEVFKPPAGGLGVHLEGRFQHVMMVKVKADGSFELECIDSVHKARDFLHRKTAGSEHASRAR
jgi:hypothetical protein